MCGSATVLDGRGRYEVKVTSSGIGNYKATRTGCETSWPWLILWMSHHVPMAFLTSRDRLGFVQDPQMESGDQSSWQESMLKYRSGLFRVKTVSGKCSVRPFTSSATGRVVFPVFSIFSCVLNILQGASYSWGSLFDIMTQFLIMPHQTLELIVDVNNVSLEKIVLRIICPESM